MFCRRKDYAENRRSKTEDMDDDGGDYLMLATPTISSFNKGICIHTAWAVRSEAPLRFGGGICGVRSGGRGSP